MPQTGAPVLRIVWNVTIDDSAGECVVVGCDELKRHYRFVVPLVAARGLRDMLNTGIDARPDLFPLSVTRTLG